MIEKKDYTIEELHDLAVSSDWADRSFVAKNCRVSEVDLIMLSKDGDFDVLCSVARNLNTPIFVLKDFIERYHDNDRTSLLFMNIARNKNVSAEILMKLAKSEFMSVRCAVAKNLNTSLETLIELSKDEHEYVRFSAAQNPVLPREAIENLLLDHSTHDQMILTLLKAKDYNLYI